MSTSLTTAPYTFLHSVHECTSSKRWTQWTLQSQTAEQTLVPILIRSNTHQQVPVEFDVYEFWESFCETPSHNSYHIYPFYWGSTSRKRKSSNLIFPRLIFYETKSVPTFDPQLWSGRGCPPTHPSRNRYGLHAPPTQKTENKRLGLSNVERSKWSARNRNGPRR